MSWPKLSQLELLCQFLEPNPPINDFGNLKMRSVSFYSSELKSLSQVCEALMRVAQAQPLSGNPDTAKRYRNTLVNQGLIQGEISDAVVLTPLGQRILSELSSAELTPEDLKASNLLSGTLDEAVRLESLIFDDLLTRVLSPDSTDKPSQYFRELLYNTQLFVDGAGRANIESLLSGTEPDLKKLYFLQGIHSAGYEVARFFRLDATAQSTALTVWEALMAELPDEPGSSIFESSIYAYVRPAAKKTIQLDARFRVHAFLACYLQARARLGHDFPILTPDLNIINAPPPRTGASGKNPYLLEGKAPSPKVLLPLQRVICGCPGSGKSHLLKSQSGAAGMHVLRTTFHSEFTYFDFVGTYRPRPVYEKAGAVELYDAGGALFAHGPPHITYDYVAGAFTRAYLLARHNPNWNIVLIVEELNRANPSAVFGDMFQLLDRDEGTGESAHSTVPNPDLLAFLSAHGAPAPAEGIRIPSNLFIWATMNSADQGVFPLDSAFRRRWHFEYLGYRTSCAYPPGGRELRYGGKLVDWDVFRGKINEKLVAEHVHEDKLIGPYFLTPSELASPSRVLSKLFLYLWEDVLRFQHNKLMKNFGSFSDLALHWKDGEGSPLAIEL